MKGEKDTSRKVAGVKGGSGHMFTSQSTGPQKPGQSAQMGRGAGKFAQGGKTKMFGKQSATPAKPC